MIEEDEWGEVKKEVKIDKETEFYFEYYAYDMTRRDIEEKVSSLKGFVGLKCIGDRGNIYIDTLENLNKNYQIRDRYLPIQLEIIKKKNQNAIDLYINDIDDLMKSQNEDENKMLIKSIKYLKEEDIAFIKDLLVMVSENPTLKLKELIKIIDEFFKEIHEKSVPKQIDSSPKFTKYESLKFSQEYWFGDITIPKHPSIRVKIMGVKNELDKVNLSKFKELETKKLFNVDELKKFYNEKYCIRCIVKPFSDSYNDLFKQIILKNGIYIRDTNINLKFYIIPSNSLSKNIENIYSDSFYGLGFFEYLK
jgi:hypothetical protein